MGTRPMQLQQPFWHPGSYRAAEDVAALQMGSKLTRFKMSRGCLHRLQGCLRLHVDVSQGDTNPAWTSSQVKTSMERGRDLAEVGVAELGREPSELCASPPFWQGCPKLAPYSECHSDPFPCLTCCSAFRSLPHLLLHRLSPLPRCAMRPMCCRLAAPMPPMQDAALLCP